MALSGDGNLYTRLLAPASARGDLSDRRFAETLAGRVLSYADLDAGAGRYAAALTALGLQPGDRVAAQVPKSLDALMLYLGTARAGGAFLPLNTAYTPPEIAYFLSDAEPRVFVCDPAAAEALAPLAAGAGARLETLGPEGAAGAAAGSLAAKAAAAAPVFETVPRQGEDLAAILYTSGTTGRSKGAMLSHDNLVANAVTLAEYWRFTEADVLLHALPIFHTHGLFVAVNTLLLAGGSLIFLPKFEIEAALTALPRATAMMGVPTFYTRLLADPRFTKESAAGMRLFISGSAPLLAATHVEFEERTGHRILERYGMTETNMNTSNPYDGERRAGTVGFALPGVEARIADPETGALAGDGEIGVIEVRGENVFKGYWRMPEKTAEELRPDGWFITGDLGRWDQDGYLVIVGRAKDLIISGGLNVYPKEVEEAIDALEGVAESAVVGAPHPDFGEAVVAVVTPQPGAALSAETIAAALAERLAKFKQPKKILIQPDLPRNAMGKVEKKKLREQAADLFS